MLSLNPSSTNPKLEELQDTCGWSFFGGIICIGLLEWFSTVVHQACPATPEPVIVSLLFGSIFCPCFFVDILSVHEWSHGWSNPHVWCSKSPLWMVKSDRFVRILICLGSTNFYHIAVLQFWLPQKGYFAARKDKFCVCVCVSSLSTPCLRNSIRPILLVTRKTKSTSHLQWTIMMCNASPQYLYKMI